MAEIAGFPYFELQFTKDARPFEPEEVRAVLDAVRAGDIDELFVVSHGWNNDIAEARHLYRGLFDSVRRALDDGRAAAMAGRRLAVLAVLWPSKKFAEEDLIPGGGASLGNRVEDGMLRAQLDELKGTFDRPDDAALEQAKQLVSELARSPQARREFVDLIRSVLPPPEDADDDASDRFFTLPGDEVMRLLEPPIRPRGRGAGDSGGAASMGLGVTSASTAGGAAGIGDLFRGIGAAARRVLNYATYYQMKERAGKVGSDGLNPLLREIRDIEPTLRMHLVGHSFGGRVVTAAAMGRAGSEPLAPASLVLIQTAFSHNGFAENFDRDRDGFFREVLTASKVAGPIVITHTKNDRAVGIAYPIASRFARQDSADLGDEDDVYGGIGRNGALHTPEAVAGELLAETGQYAFAAGKVYNLQSDRWISGHSDVTGPQVAHALLSAAAP
jgi:hypothetical protein